MKPLALSDGIVALRRSIEAGSLQPGAAVRAAHTAARGAQPLLHAFAYLPDELRMSEPVRGAPLAGIAVAVKDIIDTADMPTECGSPVHAGRQPERDAWVVSRLRAFGATVIGKSVTTEFAWRHPGPTVNPWHREHTPGGSSSGSAAAVAAGIVPLALGTQTFGSVIRPAAYCGVVGIKPTYGGIARTGVCPLAPSLDHVGLFTRGVDDAAYVLSLLMGRDADDCHGILPTPFTMPLSAFDGPAVGPAPRIGVPRTTPAGPPDDAQRAVLERTATQWRAAGAEIVPVELPADFDTAPELARILVSVEAAQVHQDRTAHRAALRSAPLTALIADGREISASVYAAARERQAALREQFDRWMRDDVRIDALLSAPASGEAPRGLASTGDAAFCTTWTLLGVPAIVLPAALGPHGLPLGVQLIGRGGDDAALLHVARWAEQQLRTAD
jgi:Asp-tRNA(Asn)/Glu-tRNA(Gln) amidotransferase A subunit family amidase